MLFADLNLAAPIQRALIEENYTTPTPIQAQAIPHVMEGRDLLGVAQTGTGKTAAFSLPLLHRLSERVPGGKRHIRSLILSPTRELALQIMESLRTYGRHLPLRSTVIYGGVGQNPQVHALQAGVDILVATPGRLMDLMNQGYVDLKHVETFILDEADRMLDMGFITDIRRITPYLPAERQTLMFSATMPGEIRKLADSILVKPVSVQVAPVSSTAAKIEQSLYFVEKSNKSQLLAHLINNTGISRAIVFTRTKRGADRVVRNLHKAGIKSEAIHGNKSQNARQRAMTNFKSGKTPILIASDIASRGIDVDDISHVFNYDLPNEPESYVHRIGRTGRAGATGEAIAFCSADEKGFLKDIEKLIRKSIPVRNDHPVYVKQAAESQDDRDDDRDSRSFNHSGHRGGSGGGRSGQSRGASKSGGGGERPNRSAGRGERSDDARHPMARTSGGHVTSHRAETPAGDRPVRGDAAPRHEAPRGSAPRGDAPRRDPARGSHVSAQPRGGNGYPKSNRPAGKAAGGKKPFRPGPKTAGRGVRAAGIQGR